MTRVRGIFTSYSNILYKNFEHIPSHSELMIEGQVLLKPNEWSGEALYVKANGKIAWLEHIDFDCINILRGFVSKENIVDLKNNEDTENNWERVPMAFIVTHESDTFLLEIGTTNSKKSESGFGLDDFVLHAR